MALTTSKISNSFVASVDWNGYLKVLEALAPNRVRIAYDGGRLELRSPSPEHERIKAQFSRALEAVFPGFDTDFLNGGYEMGPTLSRLDAIDLDRLAATSNKERPEVLGSEILGQTVFTSQSVIW